MPPIPVAQIRSKKLLEAARALVEHQAAQGRPKQSFLRRAVSTSYYALFHEICWGTVCHVLPAGSIQERLALTRSIDHTAVRKVCEWVANPNGAPNHVRPLVTSLSGTSGVVNVALAFLDLLQARHRADYDHFGGFSKPAALQYVTAAEAAIRGLAAQKKAKKGLLYALISMQVRKVE